MSEIEALTCIKFQPRINQTGYIFVARGGSGSGCYSFLGRLGTVQQLNLETPGCVTKGIVMHEFIHAIGFYHEQSREDRDDYVTINWSNIQPGAYLCQLADIFFQSLNYFILQAPSLISSKPQSVLNTM